MKISLSPLFVVALFVVASALTLAAGDRYEATSLGHKVRIEGTSTIHDWTMEGQIIAGFLEFDTAVKWDPASEGLAGATPGKPVSAKAQANIPVRSIKSGKSSMDSVMQDAMKQSAFPRIEYRLNEMVLKEHKAGGPFVFDTKGELAVSGVTNKISMPVVIQPAGENKLKVSGTNALKMTSFGVQPPAPKIALGAIKTGDDIKIVFDWVLQKK
jgi:polyisoprenoid-binding protein YceI